MNAIGTHFLRDPIKLGTDPIIMAYGGLNKLIDADAEIGRNPVMS